MDCKYKLPSRLPNDLQSLLHYWQNRQTQLGHLPSWADVNLMDLYAIAPRIFVADRTEKRSGSIRYRWRYWGTKLTTFVGADLTGKYLDDTHDSAANEAAFGHYEWVLQTRRPHYFNNHVSVIGARTPHWSYERLIVPLEGKTVRSGHILGVYVSEDERRLSNPDEKSVY